MQKVCEVCGQDYEAKRSDSKACSKYACKKKVQRLKETDKKDIEEIKKDIPSIKKDILSVKKDKVDAKKDILNKKDITFQGRKLSDLDPEQQFRVGVTWIKVKDFPYWMLEGELERDKLPLSGNSKWEMEPQEKRERFRELMYQYDCRFGARDSERNMIARY